jgi:hypothetical protein
VLATIALAISGLTLLWTIVWSLLQRRLATRPKLTVRCAWAFLAIGPNVSGRCISITATNTGLAPVTVDSSSMLIRWRRKQRVGVVDWVTQNPALPTRLEPGDRWTGLADAVSVKRGLDHYFGTHVRWSVRPVVGDSTGRGHNARPVAVGWRRLLRPRWMKLD